MMYFFILLLYQYIYSQFKLFKCQIALMICFTPTVKLMLKIAAFLFCVHAHCFSLVNIVYFHPLKLCDCFND